VVVSHASTGELVVDNESGRTTRLPLVRIIDKLSPPIPSDQNHQARIVELDSKAGKYSLQWIGFDGKEKSVLYERPDTVVVIVSARVVKGVDRTYRYIYELENMESSGQYLSGFSVQTFVKDVVADEEPGVYVSQMATHAPGFSNGVWYGYVNTENTVLGSGITPGSTTSVSLQSDAAAAVVRVKVFGGPMAITGIGEEIPGVLLDSLPAYESWPSGYTIGPSELQRDLTLSERVNEFLNSLALFTRLGWMAPSVVSEYTQALQGDINWQEIDKKVREDRNADKITTEIEILLNQMVR